MKYLNVAIIAAAIGSFATLIIVQILQRRRDTKGHNFEDIEDSDGATSERSLEIGKKVDGTPYHFDDRDDMSNGRRPGESQNRRPHPVLDYQRRVSEIYGGSTPASLGDPLVPPTIAGPMSPGPMSFSSYDNYPLTPEMASTVPLGSLRMTNERYNRDQFRSTPRLGPYYQNSMQTYPSIFNDRTVVKNIVPSFYRPYGPNDDINTLQFFGSVNAYSPFQEVVSPWEKAGILTSVNGGRDGNVILNLYRRPIAPLQDLWEYQVQDSNGFVIKLDNKYIEDGDIVRHIIGKDGLGPWRANVFVQNKYIWV